MGLLYQKRRLKVNKIKRMINANRRHLQSIRVFLSLIMIVGLIYLSYTILKLPQWYIPTAKLQTADKSVFVVRGNRITSEYKIYDMIRQTNLNYVQMFRLRTTELEKNIEQLQTVKKAYIRRYWFPARIYIVIEERTPAFLLAPNLDSVPNSALTTDGVLIEHDYLPFNSSVKAKKLLTYGVRNGVDEVWNKEKVELLLNTVRAIETYSSQEVQYVDIRNEKDVYIMIQEYLIRFGEINESSLNRAKYIASILPEARKIQQKIKYIDLRWDDSYYLRLEGAKEVVKPVDKAPVEKPKVENPQNNVQQQNSQQETTSEEEVD